MKFLSAFFVWLFVASVSATTLQVVPVWQPLSLHRTDSDSSPEGFSEPVQARVMQRPLVLQGAMPESLVSAIATSTKLEFLPPGAGKNNAEANLLKLCGITLDPVLDINVLKVAIDVSKIKIPNDINLSQSQVVRLAIIAIEKTLREYYHDLFLGERASKGVEVRIRIVGTKDENGKLVKLGKKFSVGE